VTSTIAGSLPENLDGTRPGILHSFIIEEYTIRTGIYKLQNTEREGEGAGIWKQLGDSIMYCKLES
jgi:hypothetical protein